MAPEQLHRLEGYLGELATGVHRPSIWVLSAPRPSRKHVTPKRRQFDITKRAQEPSRPSHPMRWNMRLQKLLSTALVLSCLLVLASGVLQAKSKYACDEPDPASMCNAANTCGSASAPCTI